MIDGYRGNQNLKRINTPITFDENLAKEWLKCSDDPIYFAEKYMKFITLDEGFKNIQLYDYQKDIIESFQNNRSTIVLTSRQAGKCVTFSTQLTIRNKKTGKISKISIGEFHKLLKNNEK